MRRLGALVAVVAAAMSAAGCGVSGLQLRAASRLRILSPASESTTHLPLEVRWRAADRQAASFAVFVDRAPVHPDQELRALADHICRQTHGCPDAAYYASKDVYVVHGTGLRLTTLPVSDDGARSTVHRVTVVPLDGQQRRIGESAYSVEFLVDRT